MYWCFGLFLLFFCFGFVQFLNLVVFCLRFEWISFIYSVCYVLVDCIYVYSYMLRISNYFSFIFVFCFVMLQNFLVWVNDIVFIYCRCKQVCYYYSFCYGLVLVRLGWYLVFIFSVLIIDINFYFRFFLFLFWIDWVILFVLFVQFFVYMCF